MPTRTFTPISPAPSPREVDEARTAKGGWTAASLRSFGVPWPPPSGWQAVLLKAWVAEHGAVEWNSECPKNISGGVYGKHEWSDQSPATAKAAKYWGCSRCQSVTVTLTKKTRLRGLDMASA
jgi:hypothetical protein